MDTAKTCIAVIAAGSATRMGKPKQLLKPNNQETLVQRAARVALAAKADCTCVVTGAYQEQVNKALEKMPVSLAHNPSWQTGQASSVRTAVAFAQNNNCTALLIMPADMPNLSPRHIQAVLCEIRKGEAHVVASCNKDGLAMVPCAFSQSMFLQLNALEGDTGAARIIRNPLPQTKIVLIPFASEDSAIDIDTPNDWNSYLEATYDQHN